MEPAAPVSTVRTLTDESLSCFYVSYLSLPVTRSLFVVGFPLRTTTIENSLSPEWDETFEFAVKDFTRRIDVEVLDADIVVDESMGSFVIKLEDLLHKRRVRGEGLACAPRSRCRLVDPMPSTLLVTGMTRAAFSQQLLVSACLSNIGLCTT